MVNTSIFPDVRVRRKRQSSRVVRFTRKRRRRLDFGKLATLGMVVTFGLVWTMTGPTVTPLMQKMIGLVMAPAAQNMSTYTGVDNASAQFGLCHSGGGMNCVVDGDTIWFEGRKIRIADIDTPETHPARCAEEERLGNAATIELQRLLNNGPFSLTSIDRDTDVYGRSLRIITRNGNSIGGTLVGAGLARWYGSGRQPWC
jgi:micrococcal nuclease